MSSEQPNASTPPLSGDPPASSVQPRATPRIAGFWRRLGAFAVDCVLLGIVGLALGFFLGNQFVALGPWGRLVGFAIAAAYFGVLNSRVTDGQTFGKGMFRIRVVDKDGKALSIPKATLRFLPLAIPWFLNGAPVGEAMFQPVLMSLMGGAIFGIGLSMVYLYLFNRRTRQSLHDLILGTYVIKDDAKGPVSAAPVWRVHVAVCIVVIAAAVVAPHLMRNLAVSEPFASIMKVAVAVNQESWVYHATVMRSITLNGSPANAQLTNSFLRVTAFSKETAIDSVDRARQLARLALDADSAVRDVDQIQVILVHGYDIGIASAWRSQGFVRSPAQWLQPFESDD